MKSLILFFTATILTAQTNYRGEFEDWLTAQARTHWDQRDKDIAALNTREDIARRQAYIRQTALELIGGLPTQKTPLNPRITGGFTRTGYRVENVIFESQPGFRVTANLYIPTTGKAPYPVVLGVAGHSSNGKAYAGYQKAFIGFVQRGIAVLAYDPPGQGERLEYLDTVTGKSRAGIGVGEHLMAGVPALLTGQTIARHFIWDGIRAVDYLMTRPEIDPKRIGVAGNSGGGTQAAYLALFEPRLATAISSCYITSWRELWPGPGPQDSEQIWPGFLARNLDFGDFALALAPRPFLTTSAIRDYFPIAGARATHRQLLRLFDQLGQGNNIGFFEYDDTHGWSQPRREAATRWLTKHFFGIDDPTPEANIDTEEESQLYATPTGQLATSFGSKTMRDLSIEAAAILARNRKPPTLDSIRKAIAWQEPAATTQFKQYPNSNRLELTVEGGVRIPAEHYQPGQPKVQVVYVGGTGKPSDPDIAELESHGFGVLKIDPRGSGPGYELSGSSGYNLDYQIAARTWLLGRNLLAMQAADIVAAYRYLKRQSPTTPVYLIGKAKFAPAAIIAASLEPGFQKVLLESSITSFTSVLEAPTQQGLENTISPGALAHFDLPEIMKLVSPRPVFWVSKPIGLQLHPIPARSKYSSIVRGEGWSLLRTIPALFLSTD